VASGCDFSATGLALAYLGRYQARSWTIIDVGTSYRDFKGLTLAAVVRNVENRRAPHDPNQTTLGFNPSYHNPLGANANVSVTCSLKSPNSFRWQRKKRGLRSPSPYPDHGRRAKAPVANAPHAAIWASAFCQFPAPKATIKGLFVKIRRALVQCVTR